MAPFVVRIQLGSRCITRLRPERVRGVPRVGSSSSRRPFWKIHYVKCLSSTLTWPAKSHQATGVKLPHATGEGEPQADVYMPHRGRTHGLGHREEEQPAPERLDWILLLPGVYQA